LRALAFVSKRTASVALVGGPAGVSEHPPLGGHLI